MRLCRWSCFCDFRFVCCMKYYKGYVGMSNMVEEITKIGKRGNTLYKNTFSPCGNEWIDLGILLTGLKYGAFKLSHLPPGLKAEYDKWSKKRRVEIAASNGEE